MNVDRELMREWASMLHAIADEISTVAEVPRATKKAVENLRVVTSVTTKNDTSSVAEYKEIFYEQVGGDRVAMVRSFAHTLSMGNGPIKVVLLNGSELIVTNMEEVYAIFGDTRIT